MIIEGLLLGFAYAMPIGSQNLFVIQSALSGSRLQALSTAAVVTLMDISLSMACFFGLGAVMSHLPILKPLLLAFGSMYLVYLGASLVRAEPDNIGEVSGQRVRFWRIIATAFILTWANPQALIDGSVLFGGYRSSLAEEEVVKFVLGMSAASGIWFFSLSGALSIMKKNVTGNWLRRIQVVCGSVLVLLGLKLGYQFVGGYLV